MEENLLENVLTEKTNELNQFAVESEEFGDAVSAVVKLQNAYNENIKISNEAYFKEQEMRNRARELELKEREHENEEARLELEAQKLDAENQNLKKQHKLDVIKVGVGVGTTVLTGGLYIWSQLKGYKFEETGSVSSQTFKSSFQKVNPFTKKGL